MRIKDKFIFYFLGIISPLFLIIIWILGINLIPSSGPYLPIFLLWLLSFPIVALVIQKKFEEFQFSKYKKLGGQLSEKTIQRMAFGWLILIIIFLISLTLHSQIYIKPKYNSAAAKNVLVQGIKECVVRNFNNETTKFSDINLFKSNFKKFKIQSIDSNTCFKARAIPKNKKESWFEIDYDKDTRKVSKTCGDASKSGCEEGNIW